MICLYPQNKAKVKSGPICRLISMISMYIPYVLIYRHPNEKYPWIAIDPTRWRRIAVWLIWIPRSLVSEMISECIVLPTCRDLLCMVSANERRPYCVLASFIGWAHAQNYLCTWDFYRRNVMLSGPIQDWWALRHKNAGPRFAVTPAREICLQVVHQYHQWCMADALLHIGTRRPGKPWLEARWRWLRWVECQE